MKVVCYRCGAVRAESGEWHPVGPAARYDSDVRLSHGLCEECFARELAEIKAALARHQAAPQPDDETPDSIFAPPPC